jgi:hypothetical protein
LLRLETEYKGDYARTVYEACREAHENVRAFLRHELESLPCANFDAWAHFNSILDLNPMSPSPRRVGSENGSLAWLRAQVAPAIGRLCRDHELGADARAIVREWYAQHVRPFDDPDSLV